MKKLVSIIISLLVLSSAMATATSAYAADFKSSASRPQFKIVHFIHLSRIIEIKQPTCTSRGYTKAKCLFCGREFCEYTNATGHKYDDGVIIQEADCAAEGIKAYTCVKCHNKKYEYFPKTEHKIVIDPAVEATCSEFGLTEGSHCEVCGKIIKEQYETYLKDCNIVTELIPATINSNGSYREYCTNCDYEYNKTIYRPYKIRLYKDNTYTDKFEYTGKPIEPNIAVIDFTGKAIEPTFYRYKITFENNVDIGTATVTVDFGNSREDYYNGILTAAFEIVDSIDNDKKDENEKPEKAVTTPAIISVQSGLRKNSIMIYHTFGSKSSTYDVQYSTSSNFSGAKTLRATAYNNGNFCTTNFTVDVKSFTPKTQQQYYVRIRAVDLDSKEASSWSTAKSVRISIQG